MKNAAIIGDVLKRGYLLTGQGQTDGLEQEYYKWCKVNKNPLIKAHAGYKFASVSIDMIATSYGLNEEGQKRIFWLFKKYSEKTSSIGCSHGYCSAQQIPLNTISDLIKELLVVSMECTVERCRKLPENTASARISMGTSMDKPFSLNLRKQATDSTK